MTVARFSVREIHFPDHQDEADDSTGLPLPLRIKIVARGAAGIAEATAVLDHLPGAGEPLRQLVFGQALLQGVDLGTVVVGR